MCQHVEQRSIQQVARYAGAGFTLLEVMLVVLIIGIAAAVVVPMMSSAGSMQVRAAVNMVAADLEYAKSMAISRGQDYKVVFNVGAESYQLEDHYGNVIPHPVKKPFNYVVDFKNDGRLDRVDIQSAVFGGGGNTVTFDPLGSPADGGTVTLQAGGVTRTVSVEPVTGFISVSN
jgi:type II secretion system protein H